MIDALKLMRIPFSIFLMPVFWFSLSNLEVVNVFKGLHIFLMLHLFVYPASNGYNSYFDKDEGSIGGLEKPPPVNQFLFPLVVAFDLIAVFYAAWITPLFGVLIGIYLLVSKAYSYDKIRLKKFPILSTLIVTLFQGAFIFLSVQYGMGQGLEDCLEIRHWLPALCSTIFLLGSYPLTQVYQHEEDALRGDQTLSLRLGVQGTFVFSRLFFLLGTVLLIAFYWLSAQYTSIACFLGFGIPILVYFEFWAKACKRSAKNANFKHAMRMNLLSSVCLSLAFVAMLFSDLF